MTAVRSHRLLATGGSNAYALQTKAWPIGDAFHDYES